jgi:GT2 family glycosyltransferase
MARVTVVIPSYNQAEFLEEALRSVDAQTVETEIVVVDGGSSDRSVEVIKRHRSRLLWWRSRPDNGQAAAINEGVARGQAPYVCWLNSDDFFLPGGLRKLAVALDRRPSCPMVYGKCLQVDKTGKSRGPYWTAPFSVLHLANRCFIAQPATLIRRDCWKRVGGLDEALRMSMDYDLWWRIYLNCGKPVYLREQMAANRRHAGTKTSRFRYAHYRESMAVVRRYSGRVPIKWYLAWPVRVGLWRLISRLSDRIRH